MKKQTYKKGEAIFKIGDPSRAIFLLVSGEVGLFFPTDPNTPYTQIGEMETFGEMGLVENELRNATARCQQEDQHDCRILRRLIAARHHQCGWIGINLEPRANAKTEPEQRSIYIQHAEKCLRPKKCMGIPTNKRFTN